MELPEEIQRMILTYLQKYDLLKCRLVSKTWNLESTKLLKNLGSEIFLEAEDLPTYIEFVKKGSSLRLPIELNFWSDHDEDLVGVLEKLRADLDVLTELYGEYPTTSTLSIPYKGHLRKVRCNERYDPDGSRLLKLKSFVKTLTPTAPHLKVLEFGGLSNGGDAPSSLISMIAQLTFPNVRRIEGEKFPGCNAEFLSLISFRCPNLQELILPENFEKLEWPFHKLKVLGLYTLTNPEEFIPRIKTISPLLITKFIVESFIEPNCIRDILEVIAPNLEYLSLPIHLRKGSGSEVSEPYGFLSRNHLPILPKLKHFELKFTIFYPYTFMDQSLPFVEFDKDALPALESLTILGAGVLTHVFENGIPGRGFENVREWRLRIDSDILVDPFNFNEKIKWRIPRNLEAFLTNAWVAFPNLRKLVVEEAHIPGWHLAAQTFQVKYILNGFIRSAGN